MNIILPYSKDPHNGIELKYALRSISKYLTGYDKIIIIGDWFPAWLTNTINVTKYEEARKTPKNILDKLIVGLHLCDDAAIQWQDDIYLTRPLHVRDMKYWYEGTLEDALFRTNGNYRGLIQNTACKITDKAKYYDVHTPIVYSRSGIDTIAAQYDWKQGYIIKSLYVHHTKRRMPHEPYKDCKIMEMCGDIPKQVNGSMFFSNSPEAINERMVEYWDSLYPEKSQYEK